MTESIPNMIQNQAIIQNAGVHQNSTSNIPQNGLINPSTSIYHAANQNNFGGFNFGIANSLNNLNNLNFSANQNPSYGKPQHLLARESINLQLSKNSPFDRSAVNKCWSVGKIPTRESIGMYGLASQ